MQKKLNNSMIYASESDSETANFGHFQALIGKLSHEYKEGFSSLHARYRLAAIWKKGA